MAERRANRNQASALVKSLSSTIDPSLTISEVLLRYREFIKGYYAKNGDCTKEFEEIAFALKPVRELYGSTLARELGPHKLQAVASSCKQFVKT